MDAKIFRVNYKSDFILTLTSDAGWMTPFCIKFWTGSPMLAYYASYDGETYTHCTYDPSEPTKLTVQFDDHHLPIGNLKYQVAYHFTVADFPENTEDEVTNQANVTTVIDGDTYQVMLDLNGETAPEIQFALPAYANELQRIQNEQTRIAQEQQRIANEQTRISQEAARVTEFNGIKAEALADHQRANEDHSRATSDHQNALADRSQAASDHSRAQSDHTTAGSDHSQANSDHIRAQSDHNTALSDHQTALSDHTQANTDHARAESDHTRATADSSTAAADHRTASTDHTQANTDHARAESDHQRVETDLAEVEEFSNSLGAYDISAANATGSTLATYPDLATALGTNGSNIPEALRKGGMSVKFVLTYDNNSTKYVQYRYMDTAVTGSPNPFLNTANWQGVDDEPTAGSKNLVESGGVDKKISNELYTEESKNITWVTGLVADGIVIKSSNKDRMTNLFLLKSGETVKVKTKGDGSYWFNVISSISSASSVAVNTPVTSIVVCNSTALKEYSYTAAADIYLTVCVFNDDTSEIRFKNLPKDNKLESLENSVSAIQGQVGLTVDIQSLKKEILYDENGTWKTNSARYESVIIDNIPSDTLLIKVVNTTRLSFVSDLGGLTGTINYANGSSRITVNADSIYKIPSETRYIVIATNIAGTDCTPVSIEFLGVQQIYNNPLYGKKLAVDGDSICYGAGYLGGYAKIIGERNNMTVQNLGVGGGTLAVVSGKHNICTSMLNLDDDADYIIIEGGVNDSANGVTIGNFTAGYNNTLPNTTFYGAIETICKQLSYKFKGKKYGFLIPHQMSKPMNPAWGNPDLATGVFYDAILKACTKWGVPVLDLTKEVPPFNGFAYSGNANLIAVADAYTADTAETGHGDGWHPNEAGYKKYYCDKIEAWLKTL